MLTTSICFLFLVLVHQARTRSSLSDIQSALEQTREVAVDLRMEHQRIQTKLQALEAAYATANPTRPLPPLPPAPAAAAAPASTGQHLPAAAAVLQPLEPISLHVPTNGTLGCLGWRQTGGCDPTGPREVSAAAACSCCWPLPPGQSLTAAVQDAHDHDCATKVMSEWSGYCGAPRVLRTSHAPTHGLCCALLSSCPPLALALLLPLHALAASATRQSTCRHASSPLPQLHGCSFHLPLCVRACLCRVRGRSPRCGRRLLAQRFHVQHGLRGPTGPRRPGPSLTIVAT